MVPALTAEDEERESDFGEVIIDFSTTEIGCLPDRLIERPRRMDSRFRDD
jgi:hypothetical protein